MLKNTIYYFTGTGNSLKVAKDVAMGLDNCNVASMVSYEKNMTSNDVERIGFVFPVYGEGIPTIVNKFLTEGKFPINENIYYFIIVTHGGMRGNCIPMANKILSKRGLMINSAFDIKMVQNYIGMFNIPKNANDILKTAQIKINSITKIVQGKENSKIQKTNPLIFWAGIDAKTIAKMDRNFNVSEKCNGCGICIKICPVKNVVFENNRPKYSNNCEQCLACLHHCPEKAINYKNKTQKKGRYINPDIKLEEIINGNTIDNAVGTHFA